MPIKVLFLILLFIFQFISVTKAEVPVKAAFVRDHQLWLKDGDQEVQLTTNKSVNSPQWSYDGRFIAYIDGDEQGEKSNLWIYDTNKKENYKPYPIIETSLFRWSPVANELAYLSGWVLNVTKTKDGRPYGFENVSLGVSEFAWFPNGKEFIVSTQSGRLPTGWEPIKLYQIPKDMNLNENKAVLLYSIQIDENDLFAVNVGDFKWSHDGKWVSFLGTPTPSWAMDSNPLCVLSSDGKIFKDIGRMLGFSDWFKWAPQANQLAYISGEGRFFVKNKITKVADIDASTNQVEYTPKGYVDLDLDWLSPSKVIVARSHENKAWEEGPVPTMFTSLYEIDLASGTQNQITFPKENELDVNPQVVESYLTWVRRQDKNYKADVWIQHDMQKVANIWIEDVDFSPVLFKK
ncbi:translocation protein TolB [Neobacillus sp. YX16]|uniref:translocation protein TolB n=1 Tax=Neobacillus sp. YX16 TaxID=3047874 RepID=UPI0024C313B0|nr:translocation protein TolB [Neobacillus sp. YX16]WHZ04280.1 translocation protein TolB [Neobacillus sp. YX16]